MNAAEAAARQLHVRPWLRHDVPRLRVRRGRGQGPAREAGEGDQEGRRVHLPRPDQPQAPQARGQGDGDRRLGLHRARPTATTSTRARSPSPSSRRCGRRATRASPCRRRTSTRPPTTSKPAPRPRAASSTATPIPAASPRPARSAAAHRRGGLVLVQRGAVQGRPGEAVDQVLQGIIPVAKGRAAHDEYQHYYFSQVVYVLGEERYGDMFPNEDKSTWLTWSKYREAMFPHLIEQQSKTEGNWTGPAARRRPRLRHLGQPDHPPTGQGHLADLPAVRPASCRAESVRQGVMMKNLNYCPAQP